MILSRLLKAILSGKRSTSERRYWLFYAGPENYLFEGGVRELPREVFWSCEPETSKGDLILVYRKSKRQLTAPPLMKHFGMSQETASRVTKEDVGIQCARRRPIKPKHPPISYLNVIPFGDIILE